MKYQCFIAALLLHLIIVMCFFVPEKNIDVPKATYIHAYLVKSNAVNKHITFGRGIEPNSPPPSLREAKRRSDPPQSLSFPRRRESSAFMAFLDPRFRKDDNRKHKNNNTNSLQATRLAIYLHDQIQQNLANANLPDSIQNQQIQIEFTLTNTGIIKNIKLQQSTGFKIIDQEIINAVANIQTIPAKLLLATTQQFRLNIVSSN